jgi:hypothetical protein
VGRKQQVQDAGSLVGGVGYLRSACCRWPRSRQRIYGSGAARWCGPDPRVHVWRTFDVCELLGDLSREEVMVHDLMTDAIAVRVVHEYLVRACRGDGDRRQGGRLSVSEGASPKASR